MCVRLSSFEILFEILEIYEHYISSVAFWRQFRRMFTFDMPPKISENLTSLALRIANSEAAFNASYDAQPITARNTEYDLEPTGDHMISCS